MMIAPALLVGFAKGILLLVGNGEAGDASVLNTLLHSIANGISGWTMPLRRGFMLLFGRYLISSSLPVRVRQRSLCHC